MLPLWKCFFFIVFKSFTCSYLPISGILCWPRPKDWLTVAYVYCIAYMYVLCYKKCVVREFLVTKINMHKFLYSYVDVVSKSNGISTLWMTAITFAGNINCTVFYQKEKTGDFLQLPVPIWHMLSQIWQVLQFSQMFWCDA